MEKNTKFVQKLCKKYGACLAPYFCAKKKNREAMRPRKFLAPDGMRPKRADVSMNEWPAFWLKSVHFVIAHEND